MGQKETSSTGGGDEQDQTVEAVLAENGERPSEATVNPAVAFTLLGDERDDETDDKGEPGRREEGDDTGRQTRK